MIILRILLAFFIPTLLWFLIISFFDKHQRISYFWKITLGYIIWIGTIWLFMFALWLIWISYTIANIYLILLPIILILLFFVVKYKRYSLFVLPKSFFGDNTSLWGKMFFILFILIFSYKLILAIVFVVQSPTYQDDSLWWWNMRAKVFYYRQELVLDKQDNEYLWIPGQPYDLESEQYVPVRSYLPVNNLLKTWMALNMDKYIDEYVNLINPMMYLFLILNVFFLLNFIFNKKAASIWSIVLMGFPYLWIHGTNPYADIFTATYFVISLFMTYIIVTSDKHDQKNAVFKYIFTILMLFFVLWKKEAMFYGLISLFTIFIHNILQHSKLTLSSVLNEFKNIIYRPFIWGAVILVSYLIRVGYLSVYMNHIDSLNEEYFHPDSFWLFLNVISYQGCFNLIWLFAVIIGVYYFKDIIKSKIKYLYLTFILLSWLIFYTMSSTNAHYELINQTWVNRALVTLFSWLVVILILTIFSNYHKIDDKIDNKIDINK